MLESVWYLHTQPPLFNLGLGVVLKLFPSHYGAAFHTVFLALGLVEIVGLFLLLVGLRVPRSAAAVVSALVSVSPAAILYENRLFYDYPILVLLTVASLFALRLATSPSTVWGFALFATLALVVLIRSLYQPVWIVLVLLLVLVCRVVPARSALVATALPLAIVVLLLVKNAAMFGIVSTSSFLGTNLSRVGIMTIPVDQRERLVKEGQLDAVELVPSFAPLSAYSAIVQPAPSRGVPAVDRSLKSRGKVNFNSWTYLVINKRRLSDSLHFIPRHPAWYARGVKLATERFFWPPTYPVAITGTNKNEIRPVEAAFEAVVYGSTPHANRVGFVTVIAYLVSLAFGACVLARRRAPDTFVVGFIWLTVAYTVLAAITTDLGENYRSRLPVDPLVAVLMTVLAHRTWLWLRARRSPAP